MKSLLNIFLSHKSIFIGYLETLFELIIYNNIRI